MWPNSWTALVWSASNAPTVMSTRLQSAVRAAPASPSGTTCGCRVAPPARISLLTLRARVSDSVMLSSAAPSGARVTGQRDRERRDVRRPERRSERPQRGLVGGRRLGHVLREADRPRVVRVDLAVAGSARGRSPAVPGVRVLDAVGRALLEAGRRLVGSRARRRDGVQSARLGRPLVDRRDEVGLAGAGRGPLEDLDLDVDRGQRVLPAALDRVEGVAAAPCRIHQDVRLAAAQIGRGDRRGEASLPVVGAQREERGSPRYDHAASARRDTGEGSDLDGDGSGGWRGLRRIGEREDAQVSGLPGVEQEEEPVRDGKVVDAFAPGRRRNRPSLRGVIEVDDLETLVREGSVRRRAGDRDVGALTGTGCGVAGGAEAECDPGAAGGRGGESQESEDDCDSRFRPRPASFATERVPYPHGLFLRRIRASRFVFDGKSLELTLRHPQRSNCLLGVSTSRAFACPGRPRG